MLASYGYSDGDIGLQRKLTARAVIAALDKVIGTHGLERFLRRRWRCGRWESVLAAPPKRRAFT